MKTLPGYLRPLAAAAMITFAVVFCCHSRADERVPPQLQAKLVGRLGTFDRNFRARAGAVAQVLVLHQGGNAESSFEASSVAKALSAVHDVGGLTANVEEAEYSDPPSLAARCNARHIALVFFATGLEQEMGRVASALNGVDVLTVGTSARYAESGAVVGIGLEEARPRIVLNLRSAKAQNVSFKAELLKLARIVE